MDIAPGATEEVVINAPAGIYEYYCNVPGHKAADGRHPNGRVAGAFVLPVTSEGWANSWPTPRLARQAFRYGSGVG